MLSLGIGQNLQYVTLNLGVKAFINSVDNHKTSGVRLVEKTCLYQLPKWFHDQRFELDYKGFGEDQRIAFDSSKNGISNVGKVHDDLVGDGGNKWPDAVARGIGPQEKEAR